MTTQQYKRAVGTFSNRQAAEEALNELRNSGFSMDQVSVLARDTERNEQIAGTQVRDTSDNEAREGAGAGAVTGTVLGGVGGLLVGLGSLVVPGAGPFLAAGTLATTLAGAGIGAAAGGIIGALTGLGIPEEEARRYGDRVSQGDYLVMVEGFGNEIERAGSILRNRGVRDWKTYNISNAPNRTPDRANEMYGDRQRTVDTPATSNDSTVEIVDKRQQMH
ncbi:general stress protein [Tolypothrix sp. FACHB-123]|uniref:general stress protein n=1 Tax=Tolypothrix sp. FACHB-123 TaxID=2692868 RepID=UPI00168393B0|nr:general stress protein [Tolypothrix sp. FACHB-123]MBD2356482.1 general stress protein [Tolypothrix sp. FACHB-123]